MSLYRAHPCMKCSLDVSSFLEEISSLCILLSFFFFLHCSLRRAVLCLLAFLWNSAFRRVDMGERCKDLAESETEYLRKAAPPLGLRPWGRNIRGLGTRRKEGRQLQKSRARDRDEYAAGTSVPVRTTCTEVYTGAHGPPSGTDHSCPGLHTWLGLLWCLLLVSWRLVCPRRAFTQGAHIDWEPLTSMALFSLLPSKAWILGVSLCVNRSVVSESLRPPWTVARPDSSVHGILQARILEWVAMPSSRGIFPDPGIEPGSPASEADSVPSEPPGGKQRPAESGSEESPAR